MRDRERRYDRSVLKWSISLLFLAVVVVWGVGGVLERAWRMQTANTSAFAFATMTPGTQTKAVVQLDQVAGEKLKGILLERESDTLYRVAIGNGSTVAAILTAETSVVMGRPQDIAAGAIVQLAGALDQHRVLRAKQVVILTDYVRLAESAR